MFFVAWINLFVADNKFFKDIHSDDDILLLIFCLHPGKCYAMYIHNQPKQRSLHNYRMNIEALGSKSEMKNLGITVDENLPFLNHIRNEITQLSNQWD